MANSEGRKANQAQPLGARQGTSSEKQTKRAGQAEQQSAGPDGPGAKAVGDTFKK